MTNRIHGAQEGGCGIKHCRGDKCNGNKDRENRENGYFMMSEEERELQRELKEIGNQNERRHQIIEATRRQVAESKKNHPKLVKKVQKQKAEFEKAEKASRKALEKKKDKYEIRHIKRRKAKKGYFEKHSDKYTKLVLKGGFRHHLKMMFNPEYAIKCQLAVGFTVLNHLFGSKKAAPVPTKILKKQKSYDDLPKPVYVEKGQLKETTKNYETVYQDIKKKRRAKMSTWAKIKEDVSPWYTLREEDYRVPEIKVRA